MSFKYPELLYAFFFLVIPILVHFFQLRRFRKEKFTNIKFLRKASLKTKKSSVIKKWLVLFTRLLAFTSIILAFSQPFFPDSEANFNGQDKLVYLDNSYSMQAKGSKGELLKRSIQDLLESLSPEETFSLFTNNSIHEDISLKTHRKELQEINFSPTKMDWGTVKLTANSLLSNPESQNDFLIISDFQMSRDPLEFKEAKYLNLAFIDLKPENYTNVFIDTIVLKTPFLDEIELEIHVEATGNPSTEIPVSVYDGLNLLGRKTLKLEENTASTSFRLPSTALEKGRIKIEEPGLEFDNQLFFSINASEAINVVAINAVNGDYLKRIFKGPEFDLQIFSENQVDFNVLSHANLIILNELKDISPSLGEILQKQLEENTFLILIPSSEARNNYHSFLRQAELPLFQTLIERDIRITSINHDHPLYNGVFEAQIQSFDYPKVAAYYRVKHNTTPVLSLENGEPFLFQIRNVFVFTAPLNKENSDFQNAPLVVPSIYNMGTMAYNLPELYYLNGRPTEVEIRTRTEKDQVLKLVSSHSSFIPLQRRFANKIKIYLEEQPSGPGHYNILKDSLNLGTLGFNINRKESELIYHDLDSLEEGRIYKEVSRAFELRAAEKEIPQLWKWFVIFALIFLLTETLILKYFK